MRPGILRFQSSPEGGEGGVSGLSWVGGKGMIGIGWVVGLPSCVENRNQVRSHGIRHAVALSL